MSAYRPGPLNALTDVTGLKVGHASDARLKSGVTVVVPEAPMIAGVHVMGGAPGTRETDLLAPDKTVAEVHALVLSGGSGFGLDAGSGVADALAADGIGFAVGPARVPIVPAAILFDLANGGAKDWTLNPYRALGDAAYRAAMGGAVAMGSVGAGTGPMAGRLKGGLGSASLGLPGGATVAALVACNSLGQTTMGQGPHFWAAPFEVDAEFGGLGVGPMVEVEETFRTKRSGAREATTIAVVATDAPLTKAEAHRVAIAAHDGIARAVVPAHLPFDGDLVFAAATGTFEGAHDVGEIGHGAAICLSRAIARGVFAATPAEGDLVPTWQARFGS